MQGLLRDSSLPESCVYSSEHAEHELGVDLTWLKDTKRKLEAYDVSNLEAKINRGVTTTLMETPHRA
jgi:hypothetical protein